MNRVSDYPIPSLYAGSKAEDFDSTENRDDMADALAESRDLFVYGPNGTGKSHFASVVARKLNAAWVDVPWLMLRLRRSMRFSASETELELVDPLTYFPLVVVDDLLACQKTEFGLSVLLAVVNARINDRLPTVVTCDRDLRKIESIDSSLASRLGGFHVVEIRGPDRRLER